MIKHNSAINQIITLALKEDIGRGDVTTNSVVSKSQNAIAKIVAKEEGIICGLPIAELICSTFDKKIKIKKKVKEGAFVQAGTIITELYGSCNSLLTIERTILNFLQRMSGIATETNRYVKIIEGTKAKILDTRKTSPGLRLLDKYAVKTGGGKNHRIGLFDMILIKDNHINAAGSIEKAVELCRRKNSAKVKIEVEVSSLEQVKEALEAKADIIMLDNMNITQMKMAVKLINGKCKTEASGGITKKSIRKIAETGIDYISIGALTHSVKALDIAMYIVIE